MPTWRNSERAACIDDGEKMHLPTGYFISTGNPECNPSTHLFTSTKYRQGNREIDAVSVSASKDENGKIHITLVNVVPTTNNNSTTDCIGKWWSDAHFGKINDYNSFEQPNNVSVTDFKGAT